MSKGKHKVAFILPYYGEVIIVRFRGWIFIFHTKKKWV